MKKYIELKAGDILTSNDERVSNKGYEIIEDEAVGTVVDRFHEQYKIFRRPVQHTGDVQFLMAISILVPVMVNCDGLSQDEIENWAAEMACRKILADLGGYVMQENIDWANCKVDEIQPEPSGMDRLGALQAGIDNGFINNSIPTEPKNPGKKALDYCNAQHNHGLGIAWRIFNRGNSENKVLQVQRIDEPEHEGVELTPMESDEEAWEIAKSLGWRLDENGYVLAYPGEEPKNTDKFESTIDQQ